MVAYVVVYSFWSDVTTTGFVVLSSFWSNAKYGWLCSFMRISKRRQNRRAMGLYCLIGVTLKANCSFMLIADRGISWSVIMTVVDRR